MSARGIFHPDDAERFYKKAAGQPYRPSNGTEGDIFTSAYCADCVKRGGEDNFCLIAVASFFYGIKHADYPKEWIYGADGQPTCTAFVERGPQ